MTDQAEMAEELARKAWDLERWLSLFRAEVGDRIAVRLQLQAEESVLLGRGPEMPAELLEDVVDGLLRAEAEEREEV